MPHNIILDDEIDGIVKQIGDMRGTYNALKDYRQSAPLAEHSAIDDELHATEHFAQNLNEGDSLQGQTIAGRTASMASLM